jgi:hypothetical protein
MSKLLKSIRQHGWMGTPDEVIEKMNTLKSDYPKYNIRLVEEEVFLDDFVINVYGDLKNE